MLQNGKIVERGSHEDLVDKENGVYAEFVNSVGEREQDLNSKYFFERDILFIWLYLLRVTSGHYHQGKTFMKYK